MSRTISKILLGIGAWVGVLIGYLAIQMTTPSPEKTAAKCGENMKKVAQSLEKYKQEKNGYPMRLGQLGSDLPTCPFNGEQYSYGYAGGSSSGLASSFTISCATAHKLEVGSTSRP